MIFLSSPLVFLIFDLECMRSWGSGLCCGFGALDGTPCNIIDCFFFIVQPHTGDVGRAKLGMMGMTIYLKCEVIEVRKDQIL